MRTLRLIGITLVAVLLGMNLTACSDDDDENKDDNSSTNYVSKYINGHEYVDLGLSVKWATCNMGAGRSGDYGNYYAWGELYTKSSYIIDNSQTYGEEIGSIAGDPTYDAARANWGSTWRMPTKEEMEELKNNCTWKWETQNGNKGCLVIGPNGNSIFLPTAGWREDTWLDDGGGGGSYWSATPKEDNTYGAYYLYFNNTYPYIGTNVRRYGLPIRPVSE